MVPCRADHVITEKEGELSVIAFPRFKSAWMRKYFLPRKLPPYIRVRLEEHGTAVWDLIDGKRTVREIVELLADHFDNEQNYGARVTLYITQLQKDKVVKLKIEN